MPGPLLASRLPPQGLSGARVAAEPHCCSEAAEEKALLHSGGRGPAPGVCQKPWPDSGDRQGAGSLRIFPQPPPQFLKFLGERDCSRDVVGFLKAEMRVFTCVLFAS